MSESFGNHISHRSVAELAGLGVRSMGWVYSESSRLGTGLDEMRDGGLLSAPRPL